MSLADADALDVGGVTVELDEYGNAFVMQADAEAPQGQRIAGVWYRRGAELVDNRVMNSESWTREHAQRALEGA